MVSSSDLKKHISFHLVDTVGYEAVHTLQFPYSTTLAQLVSYAEAYLPILKACVDAGITGYSIVNTRTFQDSAAAAGSDVTDTVTLLFENDANGINQVSVPGINMGLFVPGELFLDLSNPAVGAYLADMTAHFCNDVGARHVALLESLYEKGQQFR
jgi:hypothetical protein